MRNRSRSIAGLVVAAGLVLAALPALAERPCPGAEIKKWVALQGGDLPHTYQELAVFPGSVRRAVFSVLTPQERSAVWREQIAVHLRNDDSLTAEQKTFLREAQQLASPQTYEILDDERHPLHGQIARQVAAFEAMAPRVLGAEKARDILLQLGPADSATLYYVDRARAEALDPRLQTLDPVIAGNPGDAGAPSEFVISTGIQCMCANNGPCNQGYTCQTGGCDETSGGCALFGTANCTGLCKTKPAGGGTTNSGSLSN
ncbi:MAG TPA: bacteriocin fulvocin C-related protein [Thermoanaerobaculia bacterium]